MSVQLADTCLSLHLVLCVINYAHEKCLKKKKAETNNKRTVEMKFFLKK